MLEAVRQINYTIVLCNDIDLMKSFYRKLFPFSIESESDTGLTFNSGQTSLSLRERTRGYDGRGTRADLPGVQLAFLVSPDEVSQCYDLLVSEGVKILEPVTDQVRGHRTVYFSDPEGNMLEIYALVDPPKS